ncbi:hypothetical protein [Roseisolibacter sp. H3M3-2]|uniref:hypothetical protein n=1 Tax=Roseisolibacter sp. H3M3-2 TaxID=3031323 RepID=UPI0023DBD9F1|nr:hypothetical protein [Roseisolibacter sp. H3M3-2]MDF1504868.1 hypothetical protein [Roseisolibacter sp. H3M3-2]
MLDPREQKKNGFGARVAREEERHFARLADDARRARADGDDRPTPGPDARPAPLAAPTTGGDA